ncbi:MAG: methyltransferase [Candidatus Nanopelagicales bacterium]
MTTVEFGGLQITFDSRLLSPRPWTQAQSRWAASLLPDLPPGDVLELCSGAGQIGLLAMAHSRRGLVCVDVNPAAAEYTARNARAAGLRVDCRTGRPAHVLGAHERFALIIADPPWVPHEQTKQFPQDPVRAIDGGPDGLTVTRECLTAILRHLLPGGVALLQLAPGDEQADAVSGMVAGTRLTAGERRHFERGTLLRIDAQARPHA